MNPLTEFDAHLLTEDDPIAATPGNFKHELYMPQKTLLYAMLKLEQDPFVQITTGDGNVITLQTHIARIAEKFSFGKTIMALSLVASNIPPAIHDMYQVMPLSNAHNSLTGVTVPGFQPKLTVAIKYFKRLSVTIVIAAANIITQWERITVEFTSLRWITIDKVTTLRAFEKRYRANPDLTGVELIFIKAGKVTSNYTLLGEPAQDPEVARVTTRSLIGAVAMILEGVQVDRLIVDDYDTLDINSKDTHIHSRFTWLISATRRQTQTRSRYTMSHTASDYIRDKLLISTPIICAALDDVLNSVFSLRCSPKYVDQHINSTVVMFRSIQVEGGRAANILRKFEATDEIIEMANADAIKTASQNLGIDALDVGDIIRRVVGIHLEKLAHANRTVHRVKQIRDSESTAECTVDASVDVFELVKRGSDEEIAEAMHNGIINVPAAQNELVRAHDWAVARCSKYGQSLNRMRDNIRENCCQVCSIDFDKEPAYILASCCQLIVCEACIMHSAGNDAACFIRRCPNCAVDITAKTGVIRIDESISLDAINSENIEIREVSAELGDELDEIDEPLMPKNPKLCALIQFIQNVPITCMQDEYTPSFIEKLLIGKRDIPKPGEVERKILIFTMFSESTQLIYDQLTILGISAVVLRGTRDQKDESIRRFMDDINVLIVTSTHDCSGLNMPFISHIVYYHKVIDPNVEAQIAARGQRLDRKYNLEIVSLLNQDE